MLEIRQLAPGEQSQILPLLGRCFPAYWEQIAARGRKMPFDELSFAAFSGGTAAGHCGLILYRVRDARGGTALMGGVASVAVAPEWRGRGVAAQLCETLIRWAEAEPELVSLPLYTELFRVYEKSGWRRFDPPAAGFAEGIASTLSWRRGADLSTEEKAAVTALYAGMPDYPGKVIRGNGAAFHDWPRIFAEPEFRFALDGTQQYAIRVEGTLAEVGFVPGTPAAVRGRFIRSALGPDGAEMLLPPSVVSGTALTVGPARTDPMHGERVMVLDLKGAEFHRANPGQFFSLVDKF